jgi:hypothetical protein
MTSTYVALTIGDRRLSGDEGGTHRCNQVHRVSRLTELQAHGHEAPAKTAKSFGLPIVHSTINVASGRERPTVPGLEEGT